MASHDLADNDGLGAVGYQWNRGDAAIHGATGATYVLTQADVGLQITVMASYIDGQGTNERKSSSATEVVININDAPTGAVTITGTAMEDEVLSISNNLDDEDGIGTITYQWNRDGLEISGATDTDYTLTEMDVDTQITVTASYIDSMGTQEIVTSIPTDTIIPSGLTLVVGDANNDGQVTGGDLITVQQHFGNIGSADGLLYGDANDDGQVTGTDVISVQQNFGHVAAPVSMFSAVDLAMAVAPSINPLLVGDWMLRSINGQPPQGTARMSLSFSNTDRVSGFAGMNLFFGPVTWLGADMVRFGALAMTRMTGPEPLMEREQFYMTLLQEVDSVFVKMDWLQLLNGSDVVLEYSQN